MDMVRIEREERLINVEEALGRDASSVFPTESKKSGILGLDAEATKEALGAVKFVTETELLEIKAQRGERPEDGTMTVDKTLAEVLEENKKAKEDKFQEVWKSMKIGKNRPLDEEDMEFLDGVYSAEAQIEKSKRKEEQEEVAAFQLARMEAAAAAESAEASRDVVAKKQTLERKKAKPVVRSVIKAVKRSGGSAAEPVSKRERIGTKEPEVPAGLVGLADYGSDSD
mmetsp:Transcript_2902/g.8176  ORF Transcript_2902/g.8176 Transcript_2902/m.8176 type:complete len:227 (+) Transcript_2902:484-1164(+)|eukprot:CAMPEP_0117666970 /NCGR_PEP_ID=MMETSP0804-20121206/10684_1 /TAXON_ID=1074897 /ORGANISM="Tetraselmis astigmatica, Strain CCMP880" /LENGTH=226 /DNA_ID=CAMNT_0005474599 /DNA_START=411 /DNA_END=1091 /DNA_ORIENTATION=+